MAAASADKFLEFCANRKSNPTSCSQDLLGDYLKTMPRDSKDFNLAVEVISRIHENFVPPKKPQPPPSEKMTARKKANCKVFKAVTPVEVPSPQSGSASDTTQVPESATVMKNAIPAIVHSDLAEGAKGAENIPAITSMSTSTKTLPEIAYKDLGPEESYKVTMCHVCRKTFPHATLMVYHARQNHKELREYFIFSFPNPSKPQCSFCQKPFASSMALALHQDSHLKNFTCHVCNKNYISPASYYSSDPCVSKDIPKSIQEACDETIKKLLQSANPSGASKTSAAAKKRSRSPTRTTVETKRRKMSSGSQRSSTETSLFSDTKLFGDLRVVMSGKDKNSAEVHLLSANQPTSASSRSEELSQPRQKAFTLFKVDVKPASPRQSSSNSKSSSDISPETVNLKLSSDSGTSLSATSIAKTKPDSRERLATSSSSKGPPPPSSASKPLSKPEVTRSKPKPASKQRTSERSTLCATSTSTSTTKTLSKEQVTENSSTDKPSSSTSRNPSSSDESLKSTPKDTEICQTAATSHKSRPKPKSKSVSAKNPSIPEESRASPINKKPPKPKSSCETLGGKSVNAKSLDPKSSGLKTSKQESESAAEPAEASEVSKTEMTGMAKPSGTPLRTPSTNRTNKSAKSQPPKAQNSIEKYLIPTETRKSSAEDKVTEAVTASPVVAARPSDSSKSVSSKASNYRESSTRRNTIDVSSKPPKSVPDRRLSLGSQTCKTNSSRASIKIELNNSPSNVVDMMPPIIELSPEVDRPGTDQGSVKVNRKRKLSFLEVVRPTKQRRASRASSTTSSASVSTMASVSSSTQNKHPTEKVDDVIQVSGFCLDCESCQIKDCNHSNHPRVCIESFASHQLSTGHKNFQTMHQFLLQKVSITVEDIALSRIHGNRMRKLFKKLAQTSSVKKFYQEQRQCKVKNCDFSTISIVDNFRHIREKHLPQ